MDVQNRRINSSKPYGKLVAEYGIYQWNELVNHVHQLPYGRNQSRSDFTLVLKEEKGTCSSKHALLKHVALENNWSDIELILSIVKINGENTQKISRSLRDRGLDYFPEAHCYLKVNGDILDVTFPNTSEFKFKNDVLVERIIQPESVVQFKIDFHMSYMKQWCSIHNHNYDKIWLLREKCIQRLSQ